MTWAKLSDTFNDDPVLISLPRGVRLLYVELTSWSCRHDTDGHIPSVAPRRISDEDDVRTGLKALVEAGLLDETPDGWLLTRFVEEQVSADEVIKRKTSARERQERRRRHLSGDHSKCDPERCDAARSVTRDKQRDVTRDVTRESRVNHSDLLSRPASPVPSSPEGTGEGQVTSASAAAAADCVAAPPARKRCEHGHPLAADGSGCTDCPPPIPKPRALPPLPAMPAIPPLGSTPAPDGDDPADVAPCPICGLFAWECRARGYCPGRLPTRPAEDTPCEPTTSPSATTTTMPAAADDSGTSTATSACTSPATPAPDAVNAHGSPAAPAATASPPSTSSRAAKPSPGQPRDRTPRNRRAGSRPKRTGR